MSSKKYKIIISKEIMVIKQHEELIYERKAVIRKNPTALNTFISKNEKGTKLS